MLDLQRFNHICKGLLGGSLILTSILLFGCAPMYPADGHTTVSAGVRGSYGDLDQWGGWVTYGGYGDVWVPYVEAGWAPFTYGNWVWTDRGWFWSSYEPYGWIVYHYGNWYYDDDLGWFWVPGDTWAPAQVIWYDYDNYVCWAPKPPSGLSWSSPRENNATPSWTVVTRDNFLKENVGRYRTSIHPPLHSSSTSVRRHAPAIRSVTPDYHRRVDKVHVKREKTRIEHKTFYKTNLPDREREKRSRYQKQYNRGPRRDLHSAADVGHGREENHNDRGEHEGRSRRHGSKH